MCSFYGTFHSEQEEQQEQSSFPSLQQNLSEEEQLSESNSIRETLKGKITKVPQELNTEPLAAETLLKAMTDNEIKMDSINHDCHSIIRNQMIN